MKLNVMDGPRRKSSQGAVLEEKLIVHVLASDCCRHQGSLTKLFEVQLDFRGTASLYVTGVDTCGCW